MTDLPAVTVVGSVNLDTKLEVPHVPVAGETILSTRRSVSPGGKGANQAAAAAASGAVVRFVGAVGDDAHGRAAVANLRDLGVDLSGLQVLADAPSGEATVIVGERDGENLIIVHPGANARLDPGHVERFLMAGDARVLLTQLETPLSVLRACAAHPAPAWRILNPAPATGAPELRELLAGFNVLVPNRSELARLAGRPEPESLEEVRAGVAALGFAGTVIVTLGARGAALFVEPGAPPLLVPPPPVTPVDTTGAGDVFCGTLARELAEHEGLERAVRAAVRASALSTELPHAQTVARRPARAHAGEPQRPGGSR